MIPPKKNEVNFFYSHITHFFGIAIGAFLAAVAIRVFLIPHQLIDGGIVGLSLIFSRLCDDSYLSYFLVLLNLPFLYLAYKHIRRTFVLSMAIAVFLFALFLSLLQKIPPFSADILEVIVFGGALLGMGAGLIIRFGGCTDGTEILAILINRKKGFTVGQIVLFINIFIFGLYGFIFQNWHVALRSLMTYFVAFKMIDIVIEGLNELKSVMIITNKPKHIREIITNKLGLGLTIIPGIGGFTGENKEILFIIIERLDLSELKEIVLQEDPSALLTIQNLHEVAYGKNLLHSMKKKRKKIFF